MIIATNHYAYFIVNFYLQEDKQTFYLTIKTEEQDHICTFDFLVKDLLPLVQGQPVSSHGRITVKDCMKLFNVSTYSTEVEWPKNEHEWETTVDRVQDELKCSVDPEFNSRYYKDGVYEFILQRRGREDE